MYPIQVVNSHLIPMHPLLPRVYNVPLAQMSCPQYPIPKVGNVFLNSEVKVGNVLNVTEKLG